MSAESSVKADKQGCEGWVGKKEMCQPPEWKEVPHGQCRATCSGDGPGLQQGCMAPQGSEASVPLAMVVAHVI